MNNRDYKEFASETISHVYNRGNNREKIFYDDQDYKAFLFRVGLALGFHQEELNKEKLLFLPYSRIRISNINKKFFKLHAFCLMPNHFHLLIEQKSTVSISTLILKICTSYAKYFNKKYGRVGHVFQDQFKSVHVDSNSQLMWVSSYIHMNPVKAGLVKKPDQYKWSSYIDFISHRNLPIVHKNLLTEMFGNKDSFEKETLRLNDDDSENSLP